MRPTFILALLVAGSLTVAAWKNPARSPSLTEPLFSTHDYLAFQAYVLAGRPSWVRFNLRAYFIGTEAPDNGFMPADAEDAYPDAAQCHCILFDEDGNVTRDRGELRARQEFDKARQALQKGQRGPAVFMDFTISSARIGLRKRGQACARSAHSSRQRRRSSRRRARVSRE